jgi:hypothetical protein
VTLRLHHRAACDRPLSGEPEVLDRLVFVIGAVVVMCEFGRHFPGTFAISRLFAHRDAPMKLDLMAGREYSSNLESHRHGLAPITDLIAAERDLSSAFKVRWKASPRCCWDTSSTDCITRGDYEAAMERPWRTPPVRGLGHRCAAHPHHNFSGPNGGPRLACAPILAAGHCVVSPETVSAFLREHWLSLVRRPCRQLVR